MERHKQPEPAPLPTAAFTAHLELLRMERLAAESAGLGDCAAYMTDLADEIAECRHNFVLAAVTEIASMRADLAQLNVLKR